MNSVSVVEKMETNKKREAGIYPDIDIDFYHSEHGISSSGISLILECPKKYHYKYIENKLKNTASNEEQDDKDHFKIGQAMHCVLLEPDKFNDRFYVMNDYDGRTKSGKEYISNAKNSAGNKTLIKKEVEQQLIGMLESAKENKTFSDIDIKSGNVEHSIYWDNELNIRLRTRPDFYNEHIICDIKTTKSISDFERSIYKYGYYRQAAMQLDGLYNFDGVKRFFYFFAIETKPPFLCQLFPLDESYIALGREEYKKGANIYAECLFFKEWPGYSESAKTVKVPGWVNRMSSNDLLILS